MYCKYMPDQRSASHVGFLERAVAVLQQVTKREASLQRMIQENAATSSATKTKLVDLCRTRWIAKHDALTAINQLFEVVVSTQEEISGSSTDPWTPESIPQAWWASHGYHVFQFHRDNDHHQRLWPTPR